MKASQVLNFHHLFSFDFNTRRTMTLNFTITPDPSFSLPDTPQIIDAELRTRAFQAYTSYLGRPLVPSETTHGALMVLETFSLVVDTSSTTQPFAYTPRQNLIGSNFNMNITSNTSGSSSPLKVPSNSYLLLWHLARTHGVFILVFSSRSKPLCLKPSNNSPLIVLFHNVDSYLAHGEYLLLRSSGRHTTTTPLPTTSNTSPSSRFKAAKLSSEETKSPKKLVKRVTSGELSREDCIEYVTKAWYVYIDVVNCNIFILIINN